MAVGVLGMALATAVDGIHCFIALLKVIGAGLLCWKSQE
jgi:hypothetical protein